MAGPGELRAQATIARRVLRNTGLLGIGKAAGAVLHLAGLILTARLLGPAGFGSLMLVRSYAQAASGLARFQSWQTLIYFGAARADAGDRTGFRDLVAFTVAADAATGLLALLLAIFLAPMLGPVLAMDPQSSTLAQVYCLVIPLMASATPTGILRIFDRFDQLAWQSLLTPAVRLVGIGVATALGAPLWALVVAWLVSDMLGEAFLWLQAWREVRRRGFSGGARASPRRALADNSGLLRFSFAANAGATLSQSFPSLFTLFVGAMLGPVAAGLYRIAQVVTDAVAAPVELAMRSFFPEVTRLRANDEAQFRAMIRQAMLVAGSLGLILSVCVALAGPALLLAGMGANYRAISTILPIVAIGFAPLLATYPLESALLAKGRVGAVLVARLVAATAALVAAASLAGPMGLAGVGAAAALGFFVAFGVMLEADLHLRPARSG